METLLALTLQKFRELWKRLGLGAAGSVGTMRDLYVGFFLAQNKIRGSSLSPGKMNGSEQLICFGDGGSVALNS